MIDTFGRKNASARQMSRRGINTTASKMDGDLEGDFSSCIVIKSLEERDHAVDMIICCEFFFFWSAGFQGGPTPAIFFLSFSPSSHDRPGSCKMRNIREASTPATLSRSIILLGVVHRSYHGRL